MNVINSLYAHNFYKIYYELTFIKMNKERGKSLDISEGTLKYYTTSKVILNYTEEYLRSSPLGQQMNFVCKTISAC